MTYEHADQPDLERIGTALLHDMLDRFVEPEVARRQQAGEWVDETGIYRFQVLMPPDGDNEFRPAPRRMGGVTIGSGARRRRHLCRLPLPVLQDVSGRSRPTLERLLLQDVITLVYHPLGFLDRVSTNHYSSRASAASGAGSDVGRFAAYKDALFANEPPEGGPGLDDNELVELGRSVGIDQPPFAKLADAVFSGRYVTWTSYITELALEAGVGGTPTVLVAGRAVPANPGTIEAAVLERSPRSHPETTARCDRHPRKSATPDGAAPARSCSTAVTRASR